MPGVSVLFLREKQLFDGSSKMEAIWCHPIDTSHMLGISNSRQIVAGSSSDGINPAEIYYFKGELHRLRSDEEDSTKALEFYENALDAEGTPPSEIYRSMGLLYRQQDDNKQAADAFRTYLTNNPDAEDRLFIENLISTLSTS